MDPPDKASIDLTVQLPSFSPQVNLTRVGDGVFVGVLGQDFSVALPVMLTVAVMPFSYSIANGIGVGFVTWVVVRSAAGKAREISPLLWIVAAGFVLYFTRSWIESLLGR